MRKRSRTARLSKALVLSIVAHGAAIAFLLRQSYTHLPSKKGVISVDFIQPVRHELAPTQGTGPGKKAKKQPTFRPPEPEVAQSTPAAAVATSAETDAYIRSVLTLIHQRKVYPQEAVDRGEEGRVVIGVSVNADGSIENARIEESSPFQRLNQAALQTVANIKNFPPLPTGVSAPIHLHIPLVYRVEGI